MSDGTSGGDGSARAPTVARFGPDARFTAAAAVGAVLLGGAAIAGSDPAGQLLFAVAALLLLGYTVSDLAFRPRLTLSRQGLRVRSPGGGLDCAWPAVVVVRADARERFGLRAVTLEIDTEEGLVVLSRRALGAAPEDVAALAWAFGAPAPPEDG
jgi:Bacterial PH domain